MQDFVHDAKRILWFPSILINPAILYCYLNSTWRQPTWMTCVIVIPFLALAVFSFSVLASDRGRSRWLSLLAFLGVLGIIGIYSLRTREELIELRSRRAR
jgi:predicted membrane channel-forming protein YqfA (hemolysin III family)